MTPERAMAYRKQVSALLEAVLNDEISARTALNCWPGYSNEDPSVQCAYTMLWYFEADEERHHQELFYADVQLQNLRKVCDLLKRGEALPLSLIQAYRPRVAPTEFDREAFWKDPLRWCGAQFKQLRTILETHPKLQQTSVKQSNRPPQK